MHNLRPVFPNYDTQISKYSIHFAEAFICHSKSVICGRWSPVRRSLQRFNHQIKLIKNAPVVPVDKTER